MKQVVCSHGFGVRRDDRGLFTGIAQAFPDVHFEMFDYSQVHNNGDVTVRPLSEQAKMLEGKLATCAGPITLLCHSQGCVVAGLAQLHNVDKIILLTPPQHMILEDVVGRMAQRPGSRIDRYGMSMLARADGTMTYVPQEYWADLDGLDADKLYQKLANTYDVTIISANQDQVIGRTDFAGIKNATVMQLDGNHGFDDADRTKLYEALHTLLQ